VPQLVVAVSYCLYILQQFSFSSPVDQTRINTRTQVDWQQNCNNGSQIIAVRQHKGLKKILSPNAEVPLFQ
jgi:hypothetical protein